MWGRICIFPGGAATGSPCPPPDSAPATTPAQVALGLYVHLGGSMLLQVEALLGLLLVPVAEGRAAHAGGAPELQQVALEGVLDFCAQPHFVRDCYVNLDCR